ncbi:pre-toxin TG domain-containing protein [Streptomyces massasporeus]|uniref:pre-toxin TG domain-containing protein n=1 Tax=Streptomyces massasporeus TaxID=67324 RepID=UPI00381151A3
MSQTTDQPRGTMKHRLTLRLAALTTALSILLTGGATAASAATGAPAKKSITTCDNTPLDKRLTCLAKLGRVSIYGIPVLLIVAHGTHAATNEHRDDAFLKADIEKHINQYADLLSAKARLTSSDNLSPQAKAEIKKLEDQAEKKLREITLELGHGIETAVALGRAVYYGIIAVNAIADFITDPELNKALDDIIKGFDQMNSGLGKMNSAVADVNKALDEMNKGIAKANVGMQKANEGIAEANRGMAELNKAVPQIAKAAQKLRELPSIGKFDFSEALKDFGKGGSSPLDDAASKAMTSALLDLLPGIGDGKGIIEAITGKGTVTGEKLSPTDRLLGSVILLRWMKAGKSAIKAEELREAMKAEKATGKIDGWLSRQAYDKVPPSLKGFEQVNSKGVGYRWNDGKGNGVRIDQGNANNSQVYQQVDHVVINSGGKVIGRDGKPISGSIKDNARAAHIPLDEWLKWKAWNKP